jgi:hypothetical protein
LVELAKTTNSNVFINPTTAQANKSNLAQITTVNARATAMIDSYSSFTKSFPELPMASYFGTYKKAKVEQRLAANIASQTHEVISTYQDTINYLFVLNGVQEIYEQKTGEINSVVIVNTLEPNRIEHDAADLKAATARLSNYTVPPRLQASKDGMLDILNRTIAGYYDVAGALRSGSEVALDNAFLVIEKQVVIYDTEVKQLADQALDTLTILEDVNDLPTKTELLLPLQK